MGNLFSYLNSSTSLGGSTGPASIPVVYHKETDAGTDQEATPDMEECLPPEVMSPLADIAAALLEPQLACAATPDLTEAPPSLPEEPSLKFWFLQKPLY